MSSFQFDAKENKPNMINYQKFQDAIGYVKPPKSNKDENRR